MRQAPRGHYKTILRSTFPDVRIAFTHTPMSGVRHVPKEPVLEALRESDDEYAEYYINGLENETMATIVEEPVGQQQYFRSGELFFKS